MFTSAERTALTPFQRLKWQKEIIMNTTINRKSGSKGFQAFSIVYGHVASWSLLFSAGLIALAGAIIVIFGCAYEANAQFQLLQGSGRAALEAYLAHVSTHQLSFGAFLVESVTGHCFAASAAIQGVGFWLVFVLAPLVAALVLLARGTQVLFRQPAELVTVY
ncbi:hypothetical protein A8H39_00505 [Paraburkholderia fungorum]|nr:hypothetical protein A8H39_00505 [Paraburkholderia fungorum]